MTKRTQTNSEIGRLAGDAEIIGLVRDFIVRGNYGAGDRLPAERHLTSALGIPRGALRRAFDALERDGLIWRHVGKGTFLSGPRADDPQPGGNWAQDMAQQITPLRMIRARLCIEPAIAGEAALNASAESLRAMRIAQERARTATTWAIYETQDDLFHRAVATAADNLLLLGLFDQLNKVRRAVTFEAVTRDSTRPSPNHSSFAEHEAVADAIERRDRLGAQEAMRLHLHSVSRRLFEGS